MTVRGEKPLAEMDKWQDHEDRLQNLEKHREDTIRLLNDNDRRNEDRLREVKQGLEKQIDRLEKDSKERDRANAERLDRFEKKLDDIATMFGKAIKQTPPWVWPLISAIVAVGGWLLGQKG